MSFSVKFQGKQQKQGRRPPSETPIYRPLPPLQHTVGSVLATRLPPLILYANRCKQSYSPAWVHLDTAHGLGSWTDFTYETISAAFQDILRLPAQFYLPPFNMHIQNIPNLQDVQTGCLVPFLQSPLDVGSAHLGRRRDLLSGRIEVRTHERLGMFRPTLTFLSATNTTQSAPNIMNMTRLVHSATRRMVSWSSADIGSFEQGIWPLRHVATFAAYSNSRYCFVFTDTELVVGRVFIAEPENGEPRFGVEWQSIDLNASGEGVLTPALAIWALVMFSLNDNHRPIVSREQMTPISHWERYKGVSVHSYSRLTLSRPPPPAPYRQMTPLP